MYEERSLSSLSDADFPCIALLKSGACLALKARPDRNRFIYDDRGLTRDISFEALQQAYSGTVFIIRSIGQVASLDDRAGTLDPEAMKSRSGLAKTILNLALKTRRGLMMQLMAAAVISNVFMIALPIFTMAVYDRVIPHLAMETLWALSIGVMIALAIDLSIRYVRLKIADAIGMSVSQRLQARLFRNLLKIPLTRAPKTAGGLSNAVRDVDGLCQAVPQFFVSLVIDVPFFLALMALLTYIAGAVVIAPIVGLMVLVLLHALLHHRVMVRARENAGLQQKQSNMVIESVGTLEAVKATGSEQVFLQRWEHLADNAGYASHETRLWTGFSGQATMITVQFVIVFVMILGVYGIAGGGMTVGALAAATLLVGRAISPMGQLIALFDRVSQLAGAVSILTGLLTSENEAAGDETRSRATIKGKIDVKSASFKHDPEGAEVLKDITLSIEPGEKIGFIGRIGSGKSTLMRMFVRLYDATEGSVLLDEMDIRQFAPSALRDRFGYMRQEPVLFDDTLHTNLVNGLKDVSDEEIDRIVTLTGVKEIAARHPKGYSLPVGPRGEFLSGGERQAVALARTLLAGRQMLILDEPTAAMDNAMEARIVRELKPIIADRTLVVATHRASVLDLVDRVIWMDDGKILADGPKADVLARLTGKAAA